MDNFNINLVPFTKEGKNSVKILMEGELSIKNVQIAKEPLDTAIKTYDFFEMELQNVTSLDVTFIQLLYSLKKVLKNQGKSMVLNMEVTEEIKKSLENCGLTKILNPEKFRE